jgi:hypothetical protein
MVVVSVKAPQLRADTDVLSQDAGEHATVGRTLEAGEVAARVDAAPGFPAAGHQNPFAGGEPE